MPIVPIENYPFFLYYLAGALLIGLVWGFTIGSYLERRRTVKQIEKELNDLKMGKWKLKP